MSTDVDMSKKPHSDGAVRPFTDFDVGKPKYREDSKGPPAKAASVEHMPVEEFNQHIQKDLINKAYSMFGWTMFCVMLVFVIGLFSDRNNDLTFEIVRILSSIITFVLGFLFATTRR